MALTYSLRYQKLNAFNKMVLEKEGEVVIERQSFRLKGKGAQDMGEQIFYSDMKDLVIKDESLSFHTHRGEKFYLSNFFNLFDSFLKDFSKVRNDFLAESLFMKVGMLYEEYDAHVEILLADGSVINKGKSRLQFYEGSVVIIPELRECFVMYLDFIKHHEFDEDDYVLRLYLDQGYTVNISKLGTSFEDALQTLESFLGKMYGRVINNLQEMLPEFDSATLLKLAYKLKGGRALQFSTLKKMHDDMPAKLYQLAFSNHPEMKERADYLKAQCGDENFFLGLSFYTKPETKETIMRSWFVAGLLDKNVMAFGMMHKPNEVLIHLFRITTMIPVLKEKLMERVLELDQMLLVFRFDLSPLMKDVKELRKSRYKTAVKKLPFFRNLRMAFLWRIMQPTMEQFTSQLEKVFQRSGGDQEPAKVSAPTRVASTKRVD
jgi:hypothetical protein